MLKNMKILTIFFTVLLLGPWDSVLGDRPLPLNSSCIIDSQCGRDAICGSHQKCICPLGFLAQGDGTDCKMFNCGKDSDCIQLSNNTQCLSNECFCKIGFELNTDSTGCVMSKQLIGGYCTATSDCGKDTLCINQKCTCQFGETVADNQDCTPLVCAKDSDCVQLDKNSHCSIATKKCACNRKLNDKLQICTDVDNSEGPSALGDKPMPLNGQCVIDSQCGVDAICGSQEKCICPLGFLPQGDGINCKQFICGKDSDCMQFSNNTQCLSNECFCAMGFELNTDSTGCVLSRQLVGGECAATTDCGIDALCINKNCTCQFGEMVADNLQDCTPLVCAKDADCVQLDKNSHCTIATKKCGCNRKLIDKLQVCSGVEISALKMSFFTLVVLAIVKVYYF